MSGPIVTSVENVDGIMAPDYAIIRLRNGVRLLVGDSGVNVCATELDMNDGIVIAGCMFPAGRAAAEGSADGNGESKNGAQGHSARISDAPTEISR